jgi:hypothetical protein
MIVIVDKQGQFHEDNQLCNRLWAYAPFIAFAIKNDISIRVFDFDGYCDFFSGINKNKYLKFGLFGRAGLDKYIYKKFVRLIRKINRFYSLNKIGIYLDNQWNMIDWRSVLLKKRNIVFLNAWDHPKDVNSLLKNKQLVQDIFQPKEEYVTKVLKVINDFRAINDVVVGVHIRKKDYRTFLNGVYWFNDEVYLNYLKELELQLHEMGHRNICFLICSDDVVDLSRYLGITVRRIENALSIEDLYALSCCDYIIGPPSTFSMWASFYGEVPLRFIKYADERIKLNDFLRIVSQNVFEDGSVFQHVPVFD